MTDFSVVMACRNRAEQIPVSLETYRGASEYVFVDDGSTDGSLTAAHDALPAASPRYLLQTGYTGRYRPNPHEAWNLAVRKASCDVVVMVCPEVAVARDTFRMLVEAVEERVISLATVWNIKTWREGLPKFAEFRGQDFEITQANYGKRLNVGGSGNAPVCYCGDSRPAPFIFCGAFHKALWEELGGYDDEMQRGADGRFAKRALAAGVTFKGLGGAVGFHLAHKHI